MIKAVLEFVPIEVVAGLALFLGMVWVITPSLQARDIEARGFMKQCVSGVRSSNAKMAKRFSLPSAEGAVIGSLGEYSGKIYGHDPRKNPFVLLGFDRMLESVVKRKRAQQMAEVKSRLVDPASHCKCLVSKTKADTRQAYMWWISTLALSQEVGVGESFYDVLTGLDKKSVCGRKA